MTTTANDSDYGSTTVPEGALFVAADEPLLVYPSVSAAEQDLEAIDVRNGIYPIAFGPNGEPYRVDCGGNEVFIERTGEPNRPDELKALLLRYLEGRDRAADAAASLDNLLAEVWKIESDFWQEHDPYGERFGTRIPLWGCAVGVLGVAAALYAVFG